MKMVLWERCIGWKGIKAVVFFYNALNIHNDDLTNEGTNVVLMDRIVIANSKEDLTE